MWGENLKSVDLKKKKNSSTAYFIHIHFYFCDCMHLQVPFTDLVDAAKCVVKALFIREKYINRSMQTFCKTTAHSLQDLGTSTLNLGVYEDIPETPVDAGRVHSHLVLNTLNR